MTVTKAVTPKKNSGVNPANKPPILPMSYSMPLLTMRFASPAASAYVPQSLLNHFFRRK